MTIKRSLGPLAVAISFVFLACMAGSGSEALARSHERWERQAEESFYLSPGLSHQVMTEKQWHDYSRKMDHMSHNERNAYRERMHRQFMDEAREKGITLPEVSPEHGKHHKGQMGVVLAQLGAMGGAASGSAAGNAIPGGSGSRGDMDRGANSGENGFNSGANGFNSGARGFNSGANPAIPRGNMPGGTGMTPGGGAGTTPGGTGTLPGGGAAPGTLGTQNPGMGTQSPGPGAMTPGGY